MTQKRFENIPLKYWIAPNQNKVRQPFFNFENRPLHGYDFFLWEGALDVKWDQPRSKQTKKIFGSNQSKPKLNLFWLFFGLFRETKNLLFQFVSMFRTGFQTTDTNRSFLK
jgi:hypothetical protein